MRMRAHVEANAGREIDRTHVVEEDERPDQTAGHRRQYAADAEAAEIARPALDDEGDHDTVSTMTSEVVISLWIGHLPAAAKTRARSTSVSVPCRVSFTFSTYLPVRSWLSSRSTCTSMPSSGMLLCFANQVAVSALHEASAASK